MIWIFFPNFAHLKDYAYVAQTFIVRLSGHTLSRIE